MKTKTIFKKINLNTDWIEVSLNKFNDFYLIAQRDKKGHRSDTISKDLKKRGMKFVGSTIIYSYLQAIGLIYSHEEHCYLYKNK